MKNALLAALLLLSFGSYAQDTAAPINHIWHQYASDTSRTYTQITYLCDSLFTQAGYGVHTDSTSDSTWHEGKAYWKYNLWKDYWSSRCDVATGKLHDFAADAYSQLTQQGRSTSSSGTDNCLSASTSTQVPIAKAP